LLFLPNHHAATKVQPCVSAKKVCMKSSLGLLAIIVMAIVIACSPAIIDPVPVPAPFANTILGKWTLTEVQAPGIGPPGVWSAANPAGRWIDIQANGTVTGTAFPNATSFQAVDSVKFKLIDPSTQAGFHLFGHKIDTIKRELLLWILLPNGGGCIEGCGGYRFVR
jgi:hypothetical protein